MLEAADFGERDKLLKSLLVRFGTYDFETIMRSLEATEEVLKIYGGCSELLDQVSSDKAIIKDSLITAISKTHPYVPDEISEAQYVAVRNYISGFDNIFTVNYDLLLYWARNKNELEPDNYETDDGFRAERRWVGYESNQEVHCLHGGLHIYDTDTDIKKHVYTSAGESIFDQVRDNFENNKFPLFVSEPTYKKKQNRINHNPY